MLVQVWSDYICPWCYLGRDRTALLRSLGVEVVQFPFELHPELPPGGRRVSPNGRLAAVHAVIAQECADVGMAFNPPTHVPNSRLALEVAEVVRRRWQDAFPAVDDALFEPHFVSGLDIGDADVVASLVDRAGAPVADVTASVDAGDGKRGVDTSIGRAHDHGIAATPAWWFENDFVIPGVQPREFFQRVVARLRARTGETPAGPGR